MAYLPGAMPVWGTSEDHTSENTLKHTLYPQPLIEQRNLSMYTGVEYAARHRAWNNRGTQIYMI